MILSEIFSSLKTFTWSFSVGYKPAMLNAVALDEESARADLVRLLNDINEKNKIYSPLQKSSYEISNLRWKLQKEKNEFEDDVRRLKSLNDDITTTKADLLALEKEQNECLDETNYLTYGKTLSKRKFALEQKLHKYEMQSRDFETDKFYQKQITNLDTRIQNLETEHTDAENKLKELRESIETNDLTGPYTLCPIEFILDYETGSGETIEQILSGPASDVKPFYTTTIFSALDG